MSCWRWILPAGSCSPLTKGRFTGGWPHGLAAAREKRHDSEESETDEHVPMAQACVHRSPSATWTRIRENAAAGERSRLQRVIPRGPDYSRPTRLAASVRTRSFAQVYGGLILQPACTFF